MRLSRMAIERINKVIAVKHWGMLFLGMWCCSAWAVPSQTANLPRLLTTVGHFHNVESVAFSPDSKTVVSGSSDRSIKLMNVATGVVVRTLIGHRSNVESVAFSPDGKTVVSGSADNALKLWDVATGNELRTFLGHSNNVHSVAFSPDGKMAVSGGFDKSVRLWDLATGKEIYSLKTEDLVSTVAFSPDGSLVASGGESEALKIWSVITGKKSHVMKHDRIYSIAFSPDGKTVASVGMSKEHVNPSTNKAVKQWYPTIKLWDVATGREMRTFLSGRAPYNSITFSPDGRVLVSGSDKNFTYAPDGQTIVSASDQHLLRIWDVRTGKVIRTLYGHSEDVLSVAVSPDGKTIASGSRDSSVRLWSAANGKEIRTLNRQNVGVPSVSFSSDGKLIAYAQTTFRRIFEIMIKEKGIDNSVVKLWDMASTGESRKLASYGEGIASVAISPNSKTVASGGLDKSIMVWDVVTGKKLRSFSGHSKIIKSVAFSRDGKTVASASGDKTIKLWNIATGRVVRTLSGHDGDVNSVTFSPNGKMLASGSDDATIKIWRADSGLEKCTLKDYFEVNSVAFSPDGKTLASGHTGDFFSGGKSNTLKLWDINTCREISTLPGHNHGVKSVAFSPDGKTLVSGGNDGTLKIWGANTGLEMHTLDGHSSGVQSIAFSPNGETLVSGSVDNTLKLWRVSDGTLQATLTPFTDGRWAVTDPEGRFDVADLEDMPHLHWVMPDDPLTPLPLEIFMRDYYEPRLLARIMNGEKFKPVRALGELNRVQPEVKITGIEPDSEPGYVKVSVEANGVSRAYGFSDRKIATVAHDLRLFRNGQLVGYAEGKLTEAGSKPFLRTFRVRLLSGQAPLNFTAYAFNDDRVKSATAQQSYTPPTAIAIGKPRAYLITVGVNRHDNPAWNLRYAANDARQISQSLAPLLENQKSYEEVVTIPLISDTDGPNLATKANIKAVLDVLSGRKADVSAIPGGDKLRQADPDDLVLISFAGHGFGEGGLFYLIPSDNGTGSDREISPALTAHAISSDELSAWLRDVDAGNMAMIVDACHSAASVGDEFKPGPMGSRGLGQLAFDKGMRILAASQADDVALESDLIKQGLLSFALVDNGLEGKQADFKPKDKKITLEEWLSYGVNRVPSLAEEVKTGKVVASRGEVRTFSGELKKKRAIQQPALFDFTKGRRDAVLDTGLR